MASILRDIQLTRNKKIITIEKPIEAIYPPDGKSMVIQRAVPEDCLTFENGLTGAMRQNPDYILIGEVRNHTEVSEFLRAAETGHLAMSTIHTVNNVTTLNRIRALFQGEEQKRILATLGDVLRGIVNQALVKTKDGKKRFAVREILTIDYKIRKLIAEDRLDEIRAYQEENHLTMEHKLCEAFLSGKCYLKEARSKAPDQIYFDYVLKNDYHYNG
jgi:twitching motility protein PilT